MLSFSSSRVVKIGLRATRLLASALLPAWGLISGCGGGLEAGSLARPQTLQFHSAPLLALGQKAQVTASASSGLPVVFSSLSPQVCRVEADGWVLALSAGSCVVAANQTGTVDFLPAPQLTLSLTVQTRGLAAQTLQFESAPELTVGGTATVKAQASSGLAVSYSSLSPQVCNVDADSGLTQGLAAGPCTVAADQAGSPFYGAADRVLLTFDVLPSAVLGPPGTPFGLRATLGDEAATVQLSIGGTASGGSPITGYSVVSVPAGLSASGRSSPLLIRCSLSCAGYTFVVSAQNALGSGPPSAPVSVLTDFTVVATFYEPQTQPNNSVFTGRYTLNSSTRSVTGLAGQLTESMTDTPMAALSLSQQLTVAKDATGTGLLVGSFLLPTTDSFVAAHGNQAWRPGPAPDARYFGYPSSPNPSAGGVGNAYALVFVNPDDPMAPLNAAQLQQTAYADCTALGMMGASCMTGTSAAAYGTVGTMGGYPVSQRTVRQP